jgi:16S rRNA (cytidine1402-2'-O)-methyltransferase
MNPAQGTLFIVATPIGNLGDLTFRARETLERVDVIACEDTRHSLRLLEHYQIRKPLVSLHEHNEAMRSGQLIAQILSGKSAAYLTDAGTPGISDPGQRLVSACLRQGVRVEALPGPCAVITALVGSGFPADAFFFGGFLPVKSGRRRAALQQAFEREETSAFYESPHRIDGTLELLAELQPDRPVCVARELTKKFEEYRRGPASEVLAHYLRHPAKGEICLIISGTGFPPWARLAAAPCAESFAQPASADARISLTTLPIDESELGSGEYGAEMRFLGVVRGTENGQPIAGIEYSAYEAMAGRMLGRIADELQQTCAPHAVRLQHRLGFVPAGVASLVIVVATRHSPEAFSICQEYLRRVKTEAPIWKRILPVAAEPQQNTETVC